MMLQLILGSKLKGNIAFEKERRDMEDVGERAGPKGARSRQHTDGLRRLEAALKGRNVEGFSSTIRQELLLALELAGIMQSVSAG